MKPFTASFETIVLRFYLLMLVVIAPFFMGVPMLALLAVPLFFITLLGISFKAPKLTVESNTVTLNTDPNQENNLIAA